MLRILATYDVDVLASLSSDTLTPVAKFLD